MGPIPQASSRKVLAWLAAGPSSAVPARRRPKAAGNFSVGTFTMFASSTGESLVCIGSPWWKVGVTSSRKKDGNLVRACHSF